MPGLTGSSLSTGLPGLDDLLKGLIAGDNLVWQVESVEDYRPFVKPFLDHARSRGQKIVYFRFAQHEPLAKGNAGAEIHELRPELGFETFINSILQAIEQTGQGGAYVFDCLSDLAVDWFSDQMLGNLFRLTCPYLFDVGALAYFAVLRNRHSSAATGPIFDTAQIFLDVYRRHNRLYVQPVKVLQRHSPTMYRLHAWEGREFRPVGESATIADILTSASWPVLEEGSHRQGVFERVIEQAEKLAEAAESHEGAGPAAQDCFWRLLRMTISREEPILRLAEKHFALDDILRIRKRLIGTGLIGGKSVGMLLARAILRQEDPRWDDRLEPHDSFFIGSDVFYTFLVQNGCWGARQSGKTAEDLLDGALQARQRILTGVFPDSILRQFSTMLDYFGQSPIIVRSSSLLEDNFGCSFAGQYESVFCPNQGSREKRLENFLSAVRAVYASCMGRGALTYRAQRGMLDRDEQMALLVQRVSGAVYGTCYYPQLAGVGFSFNPYVWNELIDPQAGVLRLVFGLGTRAVGRSDDDYTRIVALNAPERRPEANIDQVRKYTQRKVDILDLDANLLATEEFSRVAQRSPTLPIEKFAVRERELERRASGRDRREGLWTLSFDHVLSDTPFAPDMRRMLAILEEAYGQPVDVEFTANFLGAGGGKINVVQCRPFQVRRGKAGARPPARIRPEDLILEAHGAVIGQSRHIALDRLVYVTPSRYGQLPIAQRYKVARLLGQLMRAGGGRECGNVMLLGPGRWGTTTPSLGVPVAFAEINQIAALCEIVAMREDLAPDVSLGTHFFNELVELDILYLALFPMRADNFLNERFFLQAPNRLGALLPGSADFEDLIRVVEARDVGDGRAIRLWANPLSQTALCYLDGASGNGAAEA